MTVNHFDKSVWRNHHAGGRNDRFINLSLTMNQLNKSMSKTTANVLIACAAIALLTACVGGEQPQVVRRENSAFKSTDARICLSNLTKAAVQFSALPNQNFSGGCQTIDTVKLLDFGTPATNLGAMTCPLAASFAAWAKHAVVPAARVYFGTEVVKIETFGTYNCRNINGSSSGKLSQHAFGNAVDISGFVLKDGRRITVLDGWHGKKDEQAFLRRLRQSACKRFGTVLSPDYNTAHANHLHFDMGKSMKDGSVYCR